jgi:translation elongation factor EF-G
MKSSSISLIYHDEPHHKLRAAKAAQRALGGSADTVAAATAAVAAASLSSTPAAGKVPYLINLIDSPGHVDFRCSH